MICHHGTGMKYLSSDPDLSEKNSVVAVATVSRAVI